MRWVDKNLRPQGEVKYNIPQLFCTRPDGTVVDISYLHTTYFLLQVKRPVCTGSSLYEGNRPSSPPRFCLCFLFYELLHAPLSNLTKLAHYCVSCTTRNFFLGLYGRAQKALFLNENNALCKRIRRTAAVEANYTGLKAY